MVNIDDLTFDVILNTEDPLKKAKDYIKDTQNELLLKKEAVRLLDSEKGRKITLNPASWINKEARKPRYNQQDVKIKIGQIKETKLNSSVSILETIVNGSTIVNAGQVQMLQSGPISEYVPTIASIMLAYSLHHLNPTGNIDRCIQILERARDSQYNLKGNLMLAELYQAKNNPSNAILAFERSLNRNPADLKSMLGLAKLKSESGNYSDAIKSYEGALEIKSDKSVRTELISLYRIKKLESAEPADNLTDNALSVQYVQGIERYNSGNLNESLTLFNGIIGNLAANPHPTDKDKQLWAMTIHSLANIKISQNSRTEALDLLKQSVTKYNTGRNYEGLAMLNEQIMNTSN